jgi:LDH2 family malate/lactate/ureidoglycolate dehydrogenase
MAVAVERTRFEAAALRDFVERALGAVGVSGEDARLAGEVLVASDLRGIESHGVARLEVFYVDRIRDGIIDPRAVESTVREAATSLVVDANNGLGHPVAVRTMRRTLEKATASGCAVATIRRSNHFGIAGYYAMMALEHDCIGVASTNAGRLAVPTGGREPMLGTNPFAFAIPAEDGEAFVLDMATTTVALGKLEIAKRLGKTIPEGWSVDAAGASTTDATAGMLGALLPLGGFGTETGGHKGFGLGLLADMLCGVLGGGVFAPDMPHSRNLLDPGIVSNFFMAIKIDRFRDPAEFRRDVSRSLRAFRESAPAPGFERVYTAGEPEAIRTKEHLRDGIGLDPIVVASLESVARKLEIEPPATFPKNA